MIQRAGEVKGEGGGRMVGMLYFTQMVSGGRQGVCAASSHHMMSIRDGSHDAEDKEIFTWVLRTA